MSGKHIESLAGRARKAALKAARRNPATVLLGAFGFLTLLVALIPVLKAVVRRRRRTILERTLGYIEDIGEHRGRIAERLKELLEENVDGGAVAKEVGRRITTAQRELQMVDRAMASFADQRARLAKRVRR